MNVFVDLFTNRVVIAAFSAWAIAQSLKVILTLLISKKFDSTRFWGSGGMPSSHSAMVCAMMTSIGFTEGFGSPICALACCLAGIVMYDAAGVRRSTGKNAAVLNQLLDSLAGKGFDFTLTEERLKELVGHTPVQVLAGALLGILVGTVVA